MSAVEAILTRMMQDPAFAEAIFSDAEKALAEYSLSAEEASKFKELSRAQFDVIATNPEDRKSFSIWRESLYGEGKKVTIDF